jgi:hypothetical protein
MAIAGRTFLGWAMPLHADRRLVACLGYAAQFFGSVAFICAAGTNVSLLLIGIVLFGAGFGNATSLPPLVAQREFVERDVPRVVALMIGIAQGAYAFAPAAFAWCANSDLRQWPCPPVVPPRGYSSLPRSPRASRSAHFY